MTPEQLKEAMRLASVLATRRVLHYRVSQGASFSTPWKAQQAADSARAELRAYLEQFVQPTEGEKQ